MGMFWRCPWCDNLTTHDDFGPEEDEKCEKCGWLLRTIHERKEV